jgi:hypothetical protein
MASRANARYWAWVTRGSGLGQPVWSARALGEGLRELPSGSHCRSEPAGLRAARPVRRHHTAQPRRQSLVLPTRTRDFKGLGSMDGGGRPQCDILQRQQRLLRRQHFLAVADLCRTGTCHLHSPIWHMDGPGRDLFRGRSHQPERCKERQRAAEHTRAGFGLALAVDRNNSLKLSASTGISSRTGSEFSAVGIAWQYRWGDGY